MNLALEGGDPLRIMAATADHAQALQNEGTMVEAQALLSSARAEHAELHETAEYVHLSGQLARTHLLLGEPEEAIRLVDEALPMAERLGLTRETLQMVITRGPALASVGRLREGIVVLLGAVTASASYQMPDVETRARVNLSFAAGGEDPVLAYRVAREGLELARHLGMRGPGYYLLGNASDMARRIGEWEWALPELEEAIAYSDGRPRGAHPARPASRPARRGCRSRARGPRGQRRRPDRVPDPRGRGRGPRRGSLRAGRCGAGAGAGEALVRVRYRARTAIRCSSPPEPARHWETRRPCARPWPCSSGSLAGSLRPPPARRARHWPRSRAGPTRPLAGFMDALRRYHELGVEVDAAVCAINMLTTLGATQPEVRAAAEAAAAFCERIGAKALQQRLSDALRSPGAEAGTACSGSRGLSQRVTAGEFLTP